jgi:hypothetical protein
MKKNKTKIAGAFGKLTFGILLGVSPSVFAGNITIFDGRASPFAGPSYWGGAGIGHGR